MADKIPLSQFERELRLRMKALRKARQWTQADVAAALGIETETYKKQEQRGSPRIEFAVPLAMLFGVSVHLLLTGRPEPGMQLPRPSRRPRKQPTRRKAA